MFTCISQISDLVTSSIHIFCRSTIHFKPLFLSSCSHLEYFLTGLCHQATKPNQIILLGEETARILPPVELENLSSRSYKLCHSDDIPFSALRISSVLPNGQSST